MRDPDRIGTALKEIERIWSLYPDLRLGQLLLNAAREEDLYNIEDERLLSLLDSKYVQPNK